MKSNIFTNEIIKSTLVALGEEMFIALKRSSMSPVIYEALDYGIGITDAQGRLIAQGNGIPAFIGTLDGAVQSIINKHGLEAIHPDDIFIQNSPYEGGGTHLSDVCMLKPVFYHQQLVAWTACKAHWTEIGGKDAGSVSADTTEIFQEGLFFPGIKIFERKQPNQALIDLIRANVRLPDMTLGDMWSSIAALQVGERRFIELLNKYSLDVVLAAIETMLDHAEAMVVKKLKQLPKGTFKAEDIIDSDGIGNGPFRIAVTVTISDDYVTMDYTGTDAQVPGPINMSYGGLISAAREVFMGIVDPGVPANDGCFRRIQLICPPHTLCSATHPAAVSSYYDVMVYAADVVRKALANALPGKLLAGQYGAVCTVIIAGHHTKNQHDTPFILVQPLAGGWGGGADKDGESGQFCLGNGETRNIPVEVTESCYDVLVQQYALHYPGQGIGAGQQRGGRGIVLDYLALSDISASILFSREETPPWPIQGAHSGSCNYACVINQKGEQEHFTRKQVHIKKGETIRMVTGSGAGWGMPNKRPHDLIKSDIKNEWITREEAHNIYHYPLQ